MKSVIILGASGGIARQVIDILIKKEDINLTLFLRSKSRLRNKNIEKSTIIEGNVLNYNQLKEAIAGQDIVYANPAGELEEMTKNIVKAMQENAVGPPMRSKKSSLSARLIFMTRMLNLY